MSFAGHYVNLELVHERAGVGGPRIHTRDLTLDLWLDADGELWLKDEDELRGRRRRRLLRRAGRSRA